MKSLPKGNYALCIAHPGHELRLHGFLEQAKPHLFILTDGGDESKVKSMSAYLGSIYRDTKNKRDVFYMLERPKPEEGQSRELKDFEIIADIQSGSIDFFEFYTRKMANSFIFNRIDYVVCDSLEEYDAVHDVCRAMTEAAIEWVKKKTDKQILLFDFNISKRFDDGISEDCICIQLDKDSQERKMKSIIFYNQSVFEELKQNLTVDFDTVKNHMQKPEGYTSIKELLLSINPDFFKYEYLHPEKEVQHSDTYEKLITPIRTKLLEKISSL